MEQSLSKKKSKGHIKESGQLTVLQRLKDWSLKSSAIPCFIGDSFLCTQFQIALLNSSISKTQAFQRFLQQSSKDFNTMVIIGPLNDRIINKIKHIHESQLADDKKVIYIEMPQDSSFEVDKSLIRSKLPFLKISKFYTNSFLNFDLFISDLGEW